MINKKDSKKQTVSKDEKNMNVRKMGLTKVIILVLFILYILLMLRFMIFRGRNLEFGAGYFKRLDYNIVPFKSIREFLRLITYSNGDLRLVGIANLLGNIILFIPLGFCIPYFWQEYRSIGKFLVCYCLTICVAEVVQLLSLQGCMDIDDLLLNTIGGVIGWGIFKTGIIKE